jgi:hypothetical protein
MINPSGKPNQCLTEDLTSFEIVTISRNTNPWSIPGYHLRYSGFSFAGLEVYLYAFQ